MHKPDARGYFGRFGGKFVPEVLIEPLAQLERAMNERALVSAGGSELHEVRGLVRRRRRLEIEHEGPRRRLDDGLFRRLRRDPRR